MASEARNPSGLSLLMPFLLGFAARHQQEDESRIILINPLTQSMVVGVGDGSGLLSGLSAKKGPPAASRAAIEALPVVGAGEERSECVICLEEWETGKEMPCGHRFHGECIERWLGIHGSCPVCRFSMPVDDEVEEKREEGRGVEGGIWISFSFNFGSREAEHPNENRSDSASADSSSRPDGEAES